MKWPWRRDDPEARKLEADQQRLAQVLAQWDEVRDSSARSVAHFRRNHISEAITTVYRSRR